MLPRALKIPKELKKHGQTRIDNYHWLNQRWDPKVIDYLNAENEYLESSLAHLKKFRENLHFEIIQRVKQDDDSVPYRLNGYWYYYRYEAGKEYPIYARKKEKLEAPEAILLNVNELADGHEYFQVVGLSVSEDNQYLAYGVDTFGQRKFTIRIKNLFSGEVLSGSILNTDGDAIWANDNKTIFYVSKDETTLRPFKVMKHILGSDTKNDEEVFRETDEEFSIELYKTKSKKYILIESYKTLSTEFRYLDADNPAGEFQIFHPREKEHEYSIEHFEDKFFITTNYLAKNFRLMETSIYHTEKKFWKDFIPHREDILLEGIDIFKDFFVITEREKGLINLRVMSRKLNKEYYLHFDEAAYLVYPFTNMEFDTELLRFNYTSLTTPISTFDFNMRTHEKVLLKQEEVIMDDFTPVNYHTERFYAEAPDGKMVPISLVYRKDLKKDSGNPLLLYGYGSYGVSIDASFNSARLSLIERGFIYAIAHVRGGEELGRWWYEEGRMQNKKNTFTDFIACAEFLIDNKYTAKEMLFAMGGSAGGLLIGTVINMRPDLFKGVVTQVPFVDIVTTMLDDSLPLTTGEYEQWGNPNIKNEYEYMLSYSPYDNITLQDYPAMLVTTGINDSQVQYWEPVKWVAKLRELKTDSNPILLHIEMGAGHGGKSGRFERYKEIALEYAFLLDLSGLSDLDKLINIEN